MHVLPALGRLVRLRLARRATVARRARGARVLARVPPVASEVDAADVRHRLAARVEQPDALERRTERLEVRSGHRRRLFQIFLLCDFPWMSN